jgi:hypothetical protein
VKVAEKGRKVEMTPAWVASVKPEAGPVEWRDVGKGAARGLVLRVEVSGLRTWVLRYTFAGRDRRFKIGASPAVSLKAARTSALRMGPAGTTVSAIPGTLSIKGPPLSGSPFRPFTSATVYRPYSVRPNVTDRKTAICSRVTGFVGQ